MNHCSGGPTTDQFDMLTPLVNWVEKGQAPDSVTAGARGAGNAGGVNADVPATWSAARTRPLCAYPEVARYRGSGSIEDAASFSCQYVFPWRDRAPALRVMLFELRPLRTRSGHRNAGGGRRELVPAVQMNGQVSLRFTCNTVRTAT